MPEPSEDDPINPARPDVEGSVDEITGAADLKDAPWEIGDATGHAHTFGDKEPVAAESGDDLVGRARPSRTTAIVVVALVLAVLSTYALLRSAGEAGYQSCVAKATSQYGPGGGTEEGLVTFARKRELSRCSNSPF